MTEFESKIIMTKEIYKFNKTSDKMQEILKNPPEELLKSPEFDMKSIIQYYMKAMESYEDILAIAIESADEDKDFYAIALKYVSNIYKLSSLVYKLKHNSEEGLSHDEINTLIELTDKAGDAFEEISLLATSESGGIRIDWVDE